MEAIATLEKTQMKPKIPAVQSGDTVRVHQTIREGNKKRTQMFEGVVIRNRQMGSLAANITVRRIASGVGVEKTFLLHSPNVTKVDIVRRAKVRRNFLSYLRQRRGKSARLRELAFDRLAANVTEEALAAVAEPAEEPIDEQVTELEPDEAAEPVVEESTEDLAKAENKEAAAADPAADNTSDDEQLLPAEEAQEGVDAGGEAKA